MAGERDRDAARVVREQVLELRVVGVPVPNCARCPAQVMGFAVWHDDGGWHQADVAKVDVDGQPGLILRVADRTIRGQLPVPVNPQASVEVPPDHGIVP
jgi:hypothetical protein